MRWGFVKKNFIARITVGICVFTMAIIMVLYAFVFSDRFPVETATETMEPTVVATEEKAEADVGGYIARLDGEKISVYAKAGENEEFMYTLKVRVADFSTEERENLETGIMLADKQALASFIEDFTS